MPWLDSDSGEMMDGLILINSSNNVYDELSQKPYDSLRLFRWGFQHKVIVTWSNQSLQSSRTPEILQLKYIKTVYNVLPDEGLRSAQLCAGFF